MKKYIIIALLLLITVSFWNCEKDDLCAESTPTTPSVVIDFYNALDPDIFKNVTNLVYFEVDDAGNRIGDSLIENAVSKIKIPLKSFQNSTTVRFKLILNGGDTDTANDSADFVRFNYTKEEIYVSRACGYKTNFELDPTNGFEKTTNWIQVGGIVNYSITDENKAHVKIYF